MGRTVPSLQTGKPLGASTTIVETILSVSRWCVSPLKINNALMSGHTKQKKGSNPSITNPLKNIVPQLAGRPVRASSTYMFNNCLAGVWPRP